MKRKVFALSMGLMLLIPVVIPNTTSISTIETNSISTYDTSPNITPVEITPIDNSSTDIINNCGINGDNDSLIVSDDSSWTFEYQYESNGYTPPAPPQDPIAIGWNLYEVSLNDSADPDYNSELPESAIVYKQVQTGTLTPTEGTNYLTINNLTHSDYYLVYTIDGSEYAEDSISFYNTNATTGDNLVDLYNDQFSSDEACETGVDEPGGWTWPGWLIGVVITAIVLGVIGALGLLWIFWQSIRGKK